MTYIDGLGDEASFRAGLIVSGSTAGVVLTDCTYAGPDGMCFIAEHNMEIHVSAVLSDGHIRTLALLQPLVGTSREVLMMQYRDALERLDKWILENAL